MTNTHTCAKEEHVREALNMEVMCFISEKVRVYI